LNLASLIPQLFYDIIGRAVPGATFIGCTLYAIRAQDLFKTLLEPRGANSLLVLLGFLFISYIIGALLGGIWFYICDLSGRNKKMESDLNTDLNSYKLPYLKRPHSIAFAYDHIQVWDPAAGARIAKLRAEQHMCGVVIIGAITLAAISVIMMVIERINGTTLSWFLICLLFAAIAAWQLNIHLERRFTIGLGNLWLLAHTTKLGPSTRVKKTTVAAIISTIDGGVEQILLTRRSVPPFKGKWCLPGGHIDKYETARDAIIREVKEETGLDITLQPFKYFDEIIPKENIDSIVIVFIGTGKGPVHLHKDEVSEIRWFPVSKCLSFDLAFKHNEIIETYQREKKR
jgi:8-oxo-dGTP diphosphatase